MVERNFFDSDKGDCVIVLMIEEEGLNFKWSDCIKIDCFL